MLKSHQNKFHGETLSQLAQKFVAIDNAEDIEDPHMRDIFTSFAQIYRNANRGIKGRGKGRRVGTGPGPGGMEDASFRTQSASPGVVGPSAALINPVGSQMYTGDFGSVSIGEDMDDSMSAISSGQGSVPPHAYGELY